jgi:hypothetical protein
MPGAPAAAAGAGLGQPPTQQPQAQAEATDHEAQEFEGELETPQQPPSLIVPIQRFCAAIQQGAPPDVTADLIYSFCDFLRANEMMPPEWRNVYNDPASTIDQFLKAFVPHIQASPEYLAQVGQHFLDLDAEYGPDAEEDSPGPNPKLQVVDAPTPPVPDEEQAEVQEVEAVEKQDDDGGNGTQETEESEGELETQPPAEEETTEQPPATE